MFTSFKVSSPLRVALGFIALLALNGYGRSQQASNAATAAVSRAMGVVKSIVGNEIILTTDSSSAVSISIQDSTRILRTAPGQTSLKDATAMTLQELQVGDRVLVRGTASSDGKSIVASTAVVMKQSDVAAHQEEQRAEWQKQGVGGLVKVIEPSSGAIDISVAGFAGTKNITIHTSKSTVIRRYAPDSVKFDDAKPGTLEQIRPGDQLRARGKHSEDGTELQAEEIVSGSFRNIAGTVSSVDPGQNTVSVMDLIAKRPVTVRIGPDSQVRQLPAMVAQRIAMRLKGGSGQSGAEEAGAGGAQNSVPPAGVIPPGPPGTARGGGYPGAGRASGPPDFQQMLSRLPAVALADLHKGDAVMIVATEGSANSVPTAITMLSGVETLLSATPDSSRASTLLSPWNLGSSGGDAPAQ